MRHFGSTHRAVFLDRDGVLNHVIVRDGKPGSPRTLTELVVPAGVEEACAELKAAGYLLVMVTNQPEIARGIQTRETVEAMNRLLQSQLGLHYLKVCPHDDADNCVCRKPKPGMLLAASAELEIDLSNSFLVGDRYQDVEAGRRAGCRTVLIGQGYSETLTITADCQVGSLADAAMWILEAAGVTAQVESHRLV